MPERLSFKSEPGPTPLEQSIEKAAFLENEKEEFRAGLIQHAKKFVEEDKQKGKTSTWEKVVKELEEKPDNQLYNEMINNLPMWLPPVSEGGTFGANRREEMMEMLQETPEKQETALALIKDIDAYLDENDLRERAKQIAEQSARNQKLLSKASKEAFEKNDPTIVRDVELDFTISEKEILEFKKDLYYAMRKKGYSGVQLRT